MIETSPVLRIPRWIQKDTPHAGLLVLGRGISVVRARPVITGGILYTPDVPHAFFVDEMEVRAGNTEPRVIRNVTVLLGHGMHRKRREFTNGQSIRETIRAYNKFAGKNGLDRLQAVIACDVPGKTRVKAADFDVPFFTAAGPVNINGAPRPDGGLHLRVTTDASFIGA